MGAVAQQVAVRTLGIDEPGFGDVVRLVDDYRVHYRAQSDLDGTERWLRGTASRAQMRCYLATPANDDVAVGVALVFPSPMTVRLDELWALRDLYVASGHRGKGVGRALVTRVLDDARAAGVPRIAAADRAGQRCRARASTGASASSRLTESSPCPWRCDVADRRRPLPRNDGLATGPLVVAALTTGVLLALTSRYGPHRDELYFVAAGHHPQWGYPDQPPLTPLIAAAADTLAPGSLLALRALSAVIVGVVVLLTADLARALGGDRGAQLLAAVATGDRGRASWPSATCCPPRHLDLLFWTVVVRLVVATLQHDRPRLWLAVGLTLGIGLENKHLVGFLAAGLVVGIAVTPALRHHLRSPWAWAGAAARRRPVAAQPRLAGPARLAAARAGRRHPRRVPHAGRHHRADRLPGPACSTRSAPSSPRSVRRGAWRRPGVGVLPAGPDRLRGAAGRLRPDRRQELLPARASCRRWPRPARWWSPTAGPPPRLRRFTALVAVTALFPLPALLPVLPAPTLDASFYPALNEDGLETIGWPSVVADRARRARRPAAGRPRVRRWW